MDRDIVVEIQKLIKSSAKAQGLTRSQLAKRMNVSEATIKRWWRAEGLSLHQWLRLTEAVGLSFSDIAAALNEPTREQFEYTEKQEKALAETVGLLAFFQALNVGRSPLEIMHKHSLSKASMAFYLRQLDMLGLIEWKEGLACRLKVHGEPKWKKNGPLWKKFSGEMLSQFVWPRKDKENFQLGIYEVTKKDREEVENLVLKAYAAAKSAEKRARLLKLRTETLCMITCTDHYSPGFINEVPNQSTNTQSRKGL